MNIRVVEIPENRSAAGFCGVWLYGPAAPDCAELAPETFTDLERYRVIFSPEEQEARMREWVRRYKTDEVAVYCNGCERGIRMGGGHPVHMVELIARDLP